MAGWFLQCFYRPVTNTAAGGIDVGLQTFPESLEFPPLPLRSYAGLSAIHIQIRHLGISQPLRDRGQGMEGFR